MVPGSAGRGIAGADPCQGFADEALEDLGIEDQVIESGGRGSCHGGHRREIGASRAQASGDAWAIRDDVAEEDRGVRPEESWGDHGGRDHGEGQVGRGRAGRAVRAVRFEVWA